MHKTMTSLLISNNPTIPDDVINEVDHRSSEDSCLQSGQVISLLVNISLEVNIVTNSYTVTMEGT